MIAMRTALLPLGCLSEQAMQGSYKWESLFYAVSCQCSHGQNTVVRDTSEEMRCVCQLRKAWIKERSRCMKGELARMERHLCNNGIIKISDLFFDLVVALNFSFKALWVHKDLSACF